jgi:hypothetical protein
MDSAQELVQLMREQNELLKRYLWRLRFSLLGLLLLTTGIAFGLGIVAYKQQSQTIGPSASVVSSAPYYPSWSPAPPARVVTEKIRLPNGEEVTQQRVVQDDSPGPAAK